MWLHDLRLEYSTVQHNSGRARNHSSGCFRFESCPDDHRHRPDPGLKAYSEPHAADTSDQEIVHLMSSYTPYNRVRRARTPMIGLTWVINMITHARASSSIHCIRRSVALQRACDIVYSRCTY